MKIEKTHKFTKNEVYTIVNTNVVDLIEEHRDKIEILEKSWNSSKDSINIIVKYKGDTLTSNIQILDHSVILEGKIPFKYKIFSLLIKSKIESKLSEIIDKTI